MAVDSLGSCPLTQDDHHRPCFNIFLTLVYRNRVMSKGAKQKNPFNWKEWLEQNPLKVVVLACIGACTTTATVLNYLHGEELKIEKASASQKLESVQDKLAAENDKLKEQLAGIDRHVGGESMLDVTSLTVGSSQIKKLGPEFSYQEQIRCYIALPTVSAPWESFKTSEAGLMKMIVPVLEFPGGAPDLLGKVTIAGWRASDAFHVDTNGYGQLNLFPFVFVEMLSIQDLVKGGSQVAAYLEKLGSGTEESVGRVEKALEKKGQILDQRGSKEKPGAGNEDVNAEEQKVVEQPDDEVSKYLSEVFNSDAAGLFLAVAVESGFTTSQMVDGASFRVIDAEKKANVLYLHGQVVFPATSKTKQIFWDREWIVVCTAKNFYLVQTSAPSTDERPLEGPWITQFLVGLRVPLE